MKTIPARHLQFLLFLPAFCGCAVLAASPPNGSGSAIDWAWADRARSAVLVTAAADGGERSTRVWLAVVDGHGHARSSSSPWFGDVLRNRDVTLRLRGAEFPLRAEVVAGRGDIERIQTAYRAKYGLWDWLLSDFLVEDLPLLQSRDLILRLRPR